MLKTIDVLNKFGYFKNVIRFANTGDEYYREYKDDFFELKAHVYETKDHYLSVLPDFRSLHYMKYIKGDQCLNISGIVHTKRLLGMVNFYMPVEFETERNCLAWFFCYLRAKLIQSEWEEYCRCKNISITFTKSDILVLPQMIEEKERRVEGILSLKENIDALHFCISKKELSRLRDFINNNENSEKQNIAKVYFDGDFVTWKAKDYKYVGIATGIEWPNPITITYNHEWRLPKRLSSVVYKFIFCKNGLFINGSFNPAVKVTGNTEGKIDVFDAELLSRLLKLAYFYPRYDYEKYKKFDENDFKEWVKQEVGSWVDPYLDCLTAMTAPYPFYQDDINVYKMETAIKFFKKYPKDTEPVDMYDAWEKNFPSDDDLVMFTRAEAGWKCWCNRKTD